MNTDIPNGGNLETPSEATCEIPIVVTDSAIEIIPCKNLESQEVLVDIKNVVVEAQIVASMLE